jgi:endonuclease YncB( thermonuclease family)
MFLTCCSTSGGLKKRTIISSPSSFFGIFRRKHTPLTIDKTTSNINVKQLLQNVEYKDTQTFYHDITYCKCVKVYDGDTITICTPAPSNVFYKFPVRLMGIDAPEIKGGGNNEKKLGIISRDKLRNKILGKIIRLEIIKQPEKWGRILAIVYLDDENICQWLLDNKLAIPYEGKTKFKPTEWLDDDTPL